MIMVNKVDHNGDTVATNNGTVAKLSRDVSSCT